jgi:2-polyprenyl-3-methyl-5-hydroxy-6-metoxy-1,4-benzoquinol methylase
MNRRFFFTLWAILAITTTTMMAQEHKHHQEQGPKPVNAANEHMHRSSVGDLASRFESPERDAYQKPEKVLEYLGKLQGKTIMDIGAGSGYFSVKLAKQGANVIAADVNDEFQQFIKKRIEKEKIQNIQLRKIPYDDPSLAEGEADMVLIVNTYHHINDRSAYFAKVRKGTRKDGELVVIDFFKTDVPVGPSTDHKVSIDEVVAELKAAGYTSFDVEVSLLPYQYILRAK